VTRTSRDHARVRLGVLVIGYGADAQMSSR
jgi:hypothetical protein